MKKKKQPKLPPTVDRPWRHGEVPMLVLGMTIEHWNKADEASWFQMVGKLSLVDDVVGMLPSDVEHMEFHDHAPCYTEGTQVWRLR